MSNLQAAVLVLLGALLAIGAPAFAAGPNAIVNGQFHAGTAIATSIELDTASTQLAPWRVTAGRVDVVGSYWQTVAGSNSVELGGVPAGSLAQTVNLQPGRRYELQFWLAGDPDGEPRVKRLRVAIGSLVQEFPFDTGGLSHNELGFERVRIAFTAARRSTVIAFSNVYDQYFWGPVIAGVQLNAIAGRGAPPAARNVPHHGVRPRPLHPPSPDAIVHRAVPQRPRHPVERPAHHASPRPIRHPSPRPIHHRSPRPIHHPSPRPIHHPSPRPIRHPSPRPIRHPSPRPIHHPSPRPIHRPSPQPAHHPSPRPIAHRLPARPKPRATRAPLPFYGWGSE